MITFLSLMTGGSARCLKKSQNSLIFSKVKPRFTTGIQEFLRSIQKQYEIFFQDFPTLWSSLQALKGTFNADDFVFCDFPFPPSSSLSCCCRRMSSLMSNKLIGLRTSGRCESISCFFFFLLKLFRKLPWLAAAVTSFLSSSHLTKESGKCNLRDLQQQLYTLFITASQMTMLLIYHFSIEKQEGKKSQHAL